MSTFVCFLDCFPVWASPELDLFCSSQPRLPDLAPGLFLLLPVPCYDFCRQVKLLDTNSRAGYYLLVNSRPGLLLYQQITVGFLDLPHQIVVRMILLILPANSVLFLLIKTLIGYL